MRWLSIALLLSATLAADERWIIVKSGPFEVYSEAGDRLPTFIDEANLEGSLEWRIPAWNEIFGRWRFLSRAP